MSDILKPYLKSLSDSLRNKINNNNNLINPQDFKAHIDSLPVLYKDWYGKDVIYIDYAGNVRYAYTADEFLKLTREPYVKRGYSVRISDRVRLDSDGWNVAFSDIKKYIQDYYNSTNSPDMNPPIVVCEQFRPNFHDSCIELQLNHENLLSPTLALDLTKGYILDTYNSNTEGYTSHALYYKDYNIYIWVSCIGRKNNLENVKYSLVSNNGPDTVVYSQIDAYVSMIDENTCIAFKREIGKSYYNINNSGWIQGDQFSIGDDTYTIEYRSDSQPFEPFVSASAIPTEAGEYEGREVRVCTLCGYTVYYDLERHTFTIPELDIYDMGGRLYLDRGYEFDFHYDEDKDTVTNVTVIPFLSFAKLNDVVACIKDVWCINGNTDDTMRLYAKKVGDAYEPIGLYDSVYIDDCFYADGAKYTKPFLEIGSSVDEVIIYDVPVQVIDGEYLRDVTFVIPTPEGSTTEKQYIYNCWWEINPQWSETDGYTLSVLRTDGSSYTMMPDTGTTNEFTFIPGIPVKVLSGKGLTRATVYWGDDTQTEVSGDSLQLLKHTYPGVGDYCIRIIVYEGLAMLGSSLSYPYGYPCISDGSPVDYNTGSNPYASAVKGAVWGGKIFNAESGAFASCCNLEYAIFTKNDHPVEESFQIREALFKNCSSLKNFSIHCYYPEASNISMYDEAFCGCSSLKFMSSFFHYYGSTLDYQDVSHYYGAAFKNCSSLQVFPGPQPFWGVGVEFSGCTGLRLITNLNVPIKDYYNLKAVGLRDNKPSFLENCPSLEKLFLGWGDVFDTPVVVNCPNIREFYIDSRGDNHSNYFDRDYDNAICFTGPYLIEARRDYPQLGKCDWLVYQKYEEGDDLFNFYEYESCAYTWYSSLNDALARRNPVSGDTAPDTGVYYCVVNIDFPLTTTLTGVEAQFPSSLYVNTEYNFTVQSLSESPLPNNIQVTGADYMWNPNTGSLTISNVYKAVSIEIAVLEKSALYEFIPDIEVTTLGFDITKSVDEVNAVLTTVPAGTKFVEFQDGSALQRVEINGIGGLVFADSEGNEVFIFNETTIPLQAMAGVEDLEPGWWYPDRLTEAQKVVLGEMFSGTLDYDGTYTISPSVVTAINTDVEGWNGILMGRNAIVPEPIVPNTEISTLRFAIDMSDDEVLGLLQRLTYVESGEGYGVCDLLGLMSTGEAPVGAVRINMGSEIIYALAQSMSLFYWLSGSIDFGGGNVAPKGWQNLVGSDVALSTPITLTTLPEGSELWNGILMGTKPATASDSLTAFVENDTINGFKFDTSANIDDILLGAEYTTVDDTTAICDLLTMNLSDSSSETALRLVKLTTELGDVYVVGAHNGTEMIYVYSNMEYTSESNGVSVVQGWQNLVDSSLSMNLETLPTVASIAFGALWNGIFVGNL